MSTCFQIHRDDNVATLLEDAAGDVRVTGAAAPGSTLTVQERIGHATQPIPRGAWVHLHNLASDLDVRSASLDPHSGEPTDTSSAYV